MKIDELARTAGVATTTIRLYQNKGLLAAPEVVGRTGYYSPAHLARLRLIARLQDDGFSLAGIARVVETWEDGRDLASLVGVEDQLDALLSPGVSATFTAEELVAQFPDNALDPALVQRAAALGLVELTTDGRFLVRDRRFIDTGSTLANLGVPISVILDEWEHLATITDVLAERFIDVFERHLLPPNWRDGLTTADTEGLTDTLRTLRHAAEQIVISALDAGIARHGTARLGDLLPPE